MELDPDEWRILREMGRELENEDPALASLLSAHPPDPAPKTPPPPDLRTWVRSFTMALLVIGLVLIGRAANTTPPSAEAEPPSTPSTSTPTTHDRVGVSRWPGP